MLLARKQRPAGARPVAVGRILAHGFLRLRCGTCGHDKLLAFSCKRRGFCPSCGARRMSQTAAHLVDHVIPHVPVRQWVLSLPIPLRLLLRVEAHDRKRLEQLCRYITRPALSDERVQRNAAGQVELKRKTPWRDGTTHLVMSPLELMQRLAALVPRPRLHLIRFHGVLAPNAKLRALVVPQEPEAPAQAVAPGECEANCAHHRAVRLSWARLLKRVFELARRRHHGEANLGWAINAQQLAS